MLQLRVDLPESFQLEEGVLTQEAIEWLNMYQALFAKNGLTEFKVVNIRT